MKPQKALHLHIEADKKQPKFINKTYIIFEKYDGWYGYMDLEEGLIRSQAGRVIPSCEELSKTLLKSCKLNQGRLIFEILVSGVPEFSELNGILNRSVGDYIAKGAYVKLHDFVGNPELPFINRLKLLDDIIQYNPVIQKAEPIGNSNKPEDWKLTAEEVWSRGGEGVILKAVHEPYYYGKRNFSLLKIKEEVTVDLLVTGLQEGAGKYTGMVGALLCKGSKGTQHTVSGMTDAQREEWVRNPNEIIGKVVEVKAMKILPDGQLREPRFKAIRYNKNPEDID